MEQLPSRFAYGLARRRRGHNGLPATSARYSQGVKETQGRVTGQLGHGGPLIELRTSNGMIAVH